MKVEFSAFPRALSGNVAVFVAADKQLLATAQTMDQAAGGAIARALSAGRFSGAKGQTQTMLGQSGTAARLLLLGVGEGRKLDARGAEELGRVIPAQANGSGHNAVPGGVDPNQGCRPNSWQRPARVSQGR